MPFKKVIIREAKEKAIDQKYINFTDLKNVEIIDDGGHDGLDLFNFKFKLQTKDKDFEFSARTKLERKFWFQNFQKAINFHQNQRNLDDSSISWTDEQNKQR